MLFVSRFHTTRNSGGGVRGAKRSCVIVMFLRSIGGLACKRSVRRFTTMKYPASNVFMRNMGATVLGGAAMTFLGATMIAAQNIQTEEDEKFKDWASEIEERSDILTEIDVYARVEKQGTAKGSHQGSSRSLIWHTLQGKGMIEAFRMWKMESDKEQRQVETSDMVRPGKARTYSLVRLGDQVCGHKEYIHGGMTAALIDDLFGWMCGIERTYLIDENADMYKNAKAFTAKLTINYRRPLPKDDVFLVECKVARVEKLKKVWLETRIFDRQGNVLADGEALYIITGIKKKTQ